MTGKEVVLVMIAGLEKEHVKIDMATFGEVRDGVCFGCAATNAICEIANIKIEYVLERQAEEGFEGYFKSIRAKAQIVDYFESAINSLRFGDIGRYNSRLAILDMDNLYLPFPKINLPPLNTDDYKNNLGAYKLYAESL